MAAQTQVKMDIESIGAACRASLKMPNAVVEFFGSVTPNGELDLYALLTEVKSDQNKSVDDTGNLAIGRKKLEAVVDSSL